MPCTCTVTCSDVTFAKIDGGPAEYAADDADYEAYPAALKQQLNLQLQLIKESTQLRAPHHRY